MVSRPSSPSTILPPSPAADRSPSVRLSVIVVYVAALLQGALGITFVSSSTFLRERLSMGDTLYGAAFIPLYGLAIVSSLAAARMHARFNLRAFFLWGSCSCAVMLALIAISPSLGAPGGSLLVLIAMTISGPGLGVFGIALNTAVIEIFPATRATALAYLHALLAAGTAIWPLVVAISIRRGLWPAALLALAAAILGLALLVRLRPLPGLSIAQAPAAQGSPAIPSLAPRRALRLWLWAGTVLIYGICEAVFTAWAVIFLTESRSLSLTAAAGALSVFWIAMTAGRLLAAVLVRRLGTLPIALSLCAGMGLAFLLLPHCAGTADALARFALAGFSCSALFPLLLGLASHEFPERTPQVSALFAAMVMGGLTIGSFAPGPLRAVLGLERIYTFAALAPLLLALALLALGRAQLRMAAARMLKRSPWRRPGRP
ncbi:MAG: MFS transporter [Candidatus Eisenbacteria bacterium]